MPGASQFMFGSGIARGIRNDIIGQTPRIFGVMQDISISFDGEIKELFGQFQFPVDTARGKTKIAGKTKFATINGAVFNDLFFGQTQSVGQIAFAYNELATLPAVINGTTNATTASSSPTLHFASTPAGIVPGSLIGDTTSPAVITAGTYVTAVTGTTVTMSANAAGAGVGGTDAITFSPAYTVANNTLTPLGDLGLYYFTSSIGANAGVALNELTTIAPATAAGSYDFKPTLGAYSFSNADAGAQIFFNYTYSKATGATVTIANPFMGTTPRFQLVFTEQFEGQQAVFTLLSCVSQRIMFPTRLDDYSIQEMDFSAFANPNGSVGTLSFANAN